jgi:CheY-like chemotaxis protein
MNASSEGGRVDIRSFVGAGTTVAIHLPLRREEQGPASEAAGVKPDVDWQRAVQLPVLLVDDYEMLLELNQHIISRLGFPVTTAATAEEALEIIRRDPGKYRILITDQNMPGDQGHQLIEKVVALTGERHPYFMLTSGEVREGINREVERIVDSYHVQYLPKGGAAAELFTKALEAVLLQEQSRS